MASEVSYKSVKKCLGVCFPARVCIGVRGFHLVLLFVVFWFLADCLPSGKTPCLDCGIIVSEAAALLGATV